MLLSLQQQFGQLLAVERVVDEEGDYQRDRESSDVKQASKTLPASLSRIVKNWFRHGD
jgi:hypothetical protein